MIERDLVINMECITGEGGGCINELKTGVSASPNELKFKQNKLHNLKPNKSHPSVVVTTSLSVEQ